MVMNYLVGVSVVALIYVFVFGILLSVLHLVLAGIRHWRGRPARFRWLVALRVLPILVAMIVAFPLFFTTNEAIKAFNTPVYYVWKSLCLMAGFPAVIFPVVLPLVEAWRERRASSYALSAACLLAFPLIAAVVASLVVTSAKSLDAVPPHSVFSRAVALKDNDARHYYEWNSDTAPCGSRLRTGSGVPIPPRKADLWLAPSDKFNQEIIMFWFDASAKGMFFDASEVYGCSFSVIRNNRESLMMSSLVNVYQFAYPVLFFATVLVLLRAAFTRAKTELMQHVN
jgi:hypothetical protein